MAGVPAPGSGRAGPNAPARRHHRHGRPRQPQGPGDPRRQGKALVLVTSKPRPRSDRAGIHIIRAPHAGARHRDRAALRHARAVVSSTIWRQAENRRRTALRCRDRPAVRAAWRACCSIAAPPLSGSPGKSPRSGAIARRHRTAFCATATRRPRQRMSADRARHSRRQTLPPPDAATIAARARTSTDVPDQARLSSSTGMQIGSDPGGLGHP